MADVSNPFKTGQVAGCAHFRTGRITENPYEPGLEDWEMWDIGYYDGFSEAEASAVRDHYEDEFYP